MNGRFKGGWTIRNYSNPKNSIHAIQLELAQKTYMNESTPTKYMHLKAKNIRIDLKKLLKCLEKYLIQK